MELEDMTPEGWAEVNVPSEADEYQALLRGEMTSEEWTRRLKERCQRTHAKDSDRHAETHAGSRLRAMSDDLSDPQFAKGYEKGWNEGRIDGHYDIVELLEKELGEDPERMYALAESIIKNMGPKADGRPEGRPSHARSRRRG